MWPPCDPNHWLTCIYKINFLNFIVLNLICDDWGYREATPILSAEEITPILGSQHSCLIYSEEGQVGTTIFFFVVNGKNGQNTLL